MDDKKFLRILGIVLCVIGGIELIIAGILLYFYT